MFICWLHNSQNAIITLLSKLIGKVWCNTIVLYVILLDILNIRYYFTANQD